MVPTASQNGNTFEGVVVPILTPLMPGGDQDIGSLRRLVNHLLSAGVHGIWASGTTGEFANFTDSERLRSIEAVVEEVNGRVPVIANVSGPATDATVRLGLSARESGATGVAATPPYYYPSGQDELLDHYRYIRDTLDAPLWVYNIPQTVKTAVAPATVATDSERLRSIEAVVEEVNGRVPVIANVSGPATDATVRLGLSARETGAAGVAATPPYYYPSGQDELLDHYRYIRDTLDAPLWVYNIPQTVKTAVAPATVAKLAEEGAVVGIKDSSGGGEALAELNTRIAESGANLYRFIGSTHRIGVARAVGVHGVIPGIANLLPAVSVKGWEAGAAGDEETAQRCDEILLASGALQNVAKGGSANSNNVASMKASLAILGVIEHGTMSRPMRELTEDEKQALPPILRKLGLLN